MFPKCYLPTQQNNNCFQWISKSIYTHDIANLAATSDCFTVFSPRTKSQSKRLTKNAQFNQLFMCIVPSITRSWSQPHTPYTDTPHTSKCYAKSCSLYGSSGFECGEHRTEVKELFHRPPKVLFLCTTFIQ